MNFNFSSFLNGTLRILNIANKTLPLIKEASPAIKTIRDKYQNIKGVRPKERIINTPYIEKKVTKKEDSNNLPTFFR
ncbi:MAG: hypothetical protein OSJ70_04210 [Bacilli bacterium]|nr:hypothetical protein [Bacilli bacterium]